MFVDSFVLVLVVAAFVLLIRAHLHHDRRIEQLLIKVRQLEHHAPRDLDDFDTPMVDRVRDLEQEVFSQMHPDIDGVDPNRIQARLWDLEDRVDAASSWLQPENLKLFDKRFDEGEEPTDDLYKLTNVVMSAGYQLGQHKNIATDAD